MFFLLRYHFAFHTLNIYYRLNPLAGMLWLPKLRIGNHNRTQSRALFALSFTALISSCVLHNLAYIIS